MTEHGSDFRVDIEQIADRPPEYRATIYRSMARDKWIDWWKKIDEFEGSTIDVVMAQAERFVFSRGWSS